jgi:hypothetical protein
MFIPIGAFIPGVCCGLGLCMTIPVIAEGSAVFDGGLVILSYKMSVSRTLEYSIWILPVSYLFVHLYRSSLVQWDLEPLGR